MAELTKIEIPKLSPWYPLWLPLGSVRAIIALMVVVCAVMNVSFGMTAPDWFISIMSSIVTYYFVKRPNGGE